MARGVIVAATVVVTRGQRQRAVVVPPTYTHDMVHYCIVYIINELIAFSRPNQKNKYANAKTKMCYYIR